MDKRLMELVDWNEGRKQEKPERSAVSAENAGDFAAEENVLLA